MAKNDFLPFATADGANVLSAEDYQTLRSRSNGFSAGVARSQELNTVWRQASVIAHVVAQFIADTNNSDVADDGDLDKLQAGLIQALSKTVNNTVPAASLKTAGITQLSSATDSDSETMAATPKAVKAVTQLANDKLAKDQNGEDIPDKAVFLKNLGLGDIALAGICEGLFSGNGYISIPAIINDVKQTLYIQWGSGSTGSDGAVTVTFPTKFPTIALKGFVTNGATSSPIGFGGIGSLTRESAKIISAQSAGNPSSSGVSYNYLVIGY
ncbi:hypothetical protein SODG_001503 [Sodalis praecaptivus]